MLAQQIASKKLKKFYECLQEFQKMILGWIGEFLTCRCVAAAKRLSGEEKGYNTIFFQKFLILRSHSIFQPTAVQFCRLFGL